MGSCTNDGYREERVRKMEPLDVLKEDWETKSNNESVISHIMLMRERLESMSNLVQAITSSTETVVRPYIKTACATGRGESACAPTYLNL